MSRQFPTPLAPRSDGLAHDWGAWSFAALQRGLPTRTLSRVVHGVAQSRTPAVRRRLIHGFTHRFHVDLAEAEREHVGDYASFNDFFTRALKPGARPIEGDHRVFVSPVDGTISQCAAIRDGRIIQAKGRDYSAAELLADTSAARCFNNGSFCTLYLAPFNYHRIHMPCDGTLTAWSYVPGHLFSVNPATARHVPRLFARNERLVAHFDAACGPLALIMVGALFVGSLETVWAGVVSPPHRHLGGVRRHALTRPLHYVRGEEIGRFNMGSTVILLAAPDALRWNAETAPTHVVRVGRALAEITESQP